MAWPSLGGNTLGHERKPGYYTRSPLSLGSPSSGLMAGCGGIYCVITMEVSARESLSQLTNQSGIYWVLPVYCFLTRLPSCSDLGFFLNLFLLVLWFVSSFPDLAACENHLRRFKSHGQPCWRPLKSESLWRSPDLVFWHAAPHIYTSGLALSCLRVLCTVFPFQWQWLSLSLTVLLF